MIVICMAFEILHYWPFHGRMMDEIPHLYPLWTEALEARYLHTGKNYTRADYDKLFDGFNVSCNIPGTLVAADLIRAYPEAKVVVSTREVDRWLRSMRQSVDSAVSWKSFDWWTPWDPGSARHTWMITPGFNTRDGWGPLCEFPGVPVPDVRFPHVNNTEQLLAG
ncbi:sulfotransferase family protein [Aspergillus fijiensis CBS 313.89]|uniref:NAD dependent epimerase/dehydratase n=1 Tax=Aspergillus fijiensis CBS 313.89 TaxID=1448319 RepID=A0A8G1RY81_9EURO|nr:uncharacterized protein BO72DRAFT_492000 [Aspergillus fijiensis CBS 313.89]RAK81770.1 hypothetical protein BO72DRAFT_492000 [Aspergillus fijiensis CBS 313.89]